MLMKTDIQTLNGAKAILNTLKSFGVDTVFGYPGGMVLDIYDELYKDNEIKHILVRHEQTAVHAAEGYARQTGKCGVVFVTSGPGATNTVSGIVNAYLDGYPLIVLCGQVSQNLLGKNAFQEADICSITKSCTKKNYRITSANDIYSTLTDAYKTAMSGKKGPVVVDMVKDIFKQQTELTISSDINISVSSYINTENLVYSLNNSQKPVIVCGGGVKHSAAEEILLKFATSHNLPVVSTMMGLGAYPQDSANYFGMLGIFGDNSAKKIVEASDLVISLGARLNDRRGVELEGKLFQIDINKDEISNFVKTDNYIVGDVKEVLLNLNGIKDFKSWMFNAQEYKKFNTKVQKQTNMLHSFEVIKSLEEYTKGRNITFTSEVGQHLLSAVKNLSFYKDRQIFVSGGSGTMGFGFPAAIGAAVASGGSPVVCISGDGSFQMGLHELATCKDYGLNIKILILNNGYLGMVRQLQEEQMQGRYSQTRISNPDFVMLAKSYGIDALRVNSKSEINDALEKAFSDNKTFVLEFITEPCENI